MGQFSWLDCVTGEQIIDDKIKDVYVLVPKEFRKKYGKRIKEYCYDGYGNFGGYDIYDLVADWNREYISKHPEHETIDSIVCDKEWYDEYTDLSKSREEVEEELNEEWREIGIDLACYDEDNAKLKYPIKITYNADAVYEECEPSLGDPNQGWETDDEDDEW